MLNELISMAHGVAQFLGISGVTGIIKSSLISSSNWASFMLTNAGVIFAWSVNRFSRSA